MTTPLISKEHYDLIDNFERIFKPSADKEPKALWAKGYVYRNGETNEKFIAFRHGYALAKHLYQTD